VEKEDMLIDKKKLYIGLIGAPLLLIAFLFFGSRIKPPINASIITTSGYLEYPAEYNYRQSGNDCGPFNVAAVTRALRKKNVSSTLLAREIGWRLSNNYTLPWGLESQLKSFNIHIEKPHFGLLTDDEKIMLLQEYLSLGKPIIILGERDNYEHYITILGFASGADQYDIYDSLQAPLPGKPDMTTDDNDSFPGNATMKSSELLNFWRGGGMYGFWEWYGLVASL